jgi:hypothetical protein
LKIESKGFAGGKRKSPAKRPGFTHATLHPRNYFAGAAFVM